jgi:threonine/homoserine/homoserine lactone efflux protein
MANMPVAMIHAAEMTCGHTQSGLLGEAAMPRVVPDRQMVIILGMEDPLFFALSVLAILCTPGPTNTLLAISGATVGLRRSLILLPAEALGYLISVMTLGLLLGPLAVALPVVRIGMRVAVAAFLLVLARQLWRQGAVIENGEHRIVGAAQIFVTTLLNPKAIILAFGVIPFGTAHLWRYLVGFLGLLLMVSLCWLALGAGAGRSARVGSRRRVVSRLGAAAIGVLAIVVVVSPIFR